VLMRRGGELTVGLGFRWPVARLRTGGGRR
jgi:hypothetical protein